MAEKKTNTSAGLETPTETSERAKAMLGSVTTNGSDSEAFNKTVENRLLGQANIVSSFDTQLEQSYTDAAKGIRAGNEASKARIESVYARERQGIQEAGDSNLTNFGESRSGFATQMAGLRAVVKTTDKNLNDLLQRKEELILQGDSQTASQISGLIIDQLKFKQASEQQVFGNLLGLANYGQQKEQSAAQLAQSKYQFDQKMKYDETTAMSSIALQYGLQTQPGETLTDLYSRATADMGADSPAALAIKAAKSEIDRNNADIRRIQNEINKSNETTVMSEADKEIIANAMAANPSLAGGLLAGIKDTSVQADLISRAGQKGYTAAITNAKNQDVSKDDLRAQYINDNTLSAPEKAAALQAVESIYGPTPEPEPSSPVGIRTVSKSLTDASTDMWAGIFKFLSN